MTMSQQLLALKDAVTKKVEYLDTMSGVVYADAEGLRKLRQMEETEFVLGDRGVAITDATGQKIHRSQLQTEAIRHAYQQTADLLGRKVSCKSDEPGRLVMMDLAPTDVHTAAAITNYAGGYHIADGVADMAAPVILSAKQQNVYYTWNVASDFNRKLGAATAPGAAVSEVNPSLSPATYSTVQYALGGFLPTEVQANADTPLRPFNKMVQIIVDGLRLEREYRVATALQTSANWNANLVQTLAAGSQWDGGAAADPIAVFHHAIEQSYMSDNLLAVMSELVWHDFLRSPALQKFVQYKNGVPALPKEVDIRREFGLPPFYVASMKYTTAGGNLQYVWGNHAVLVRIPKEMPPTSQMEVATMSTFRWYGGEAPDGTLTGGMLVRTFYDPKRGARGGTQVVVTHNDAEQMTSGLVGGLILNAHQ